MIKCSDVKKFTAKYVFLCFIGPMFYITFSNYNEISSGLLQSRFALNMQLASAYMSIPIFLSTCLNPFFGYAFDKLGARPMFLLYAIMLYFVAHSALSFFPEAYVGFPEYRCVFPLILMGVGYSFFLSTFYSSIPYVVDPSVLGTAYGILVCFQSIMTTLGTFLVAFLIDHTLEYKNGFFAVTCFMMCLSICGSIIASKFFYEDYSKGQILFSNRPAFVLEYHKNKELKSHQLEVSKTEIVINK